MKKRIVGFLLALSLIFGAGYVGAEIFGVGTSGVSIISTLFYKTSTVSVGELQGSATALQLPDVPCNLFMLKAESSNASGCYIGGSNVTVADGTTDTTTGIALEAGDSTPWIAVSNLNTLFRICDDAGDDLTYICLA